MRIRLGLALSMMLILPWTASAQDPLLRYVPNLADIVVKIDHPARVAETLYQHPVVQDFLKIDGVSDLFDTTNFRRLLQIRDHFEKSLGVKGMELLDRLTGGGAVLAVRTHTPPAILLAVQSKDEALLRKFVQLSVSIAEQELARQESKEKIKHSKFGNIAGYQVGKAHIAVVGSTLFVASDPLVIIAALTQSKLKKGSVTDRPHFKAAQNLLPKQTLAWAWVDFESIRKIDNFKSGLDAAGMDVGATFLAGGIIDAIRRAPFLLTSLSAEGKNFVLEQRMPVGREGMNPKAAMLLPQDDKGSLPVLEPAGTLFSLSTFLDLKAIWDKRETLLKKKELKDLEDFDAKSGLFLGGNKLSTLLQQAGTHQRVVVAQPGKSPYKIKPRQPVPAFAVVQEMRDPAFGKTLDLVLRGAGILGSFKFGLSSVEEKHGPHKVVAYYFPEDKQLDEDPGNLRFNYSPSFVIVNDQLVVSSTAELAHQLIDELTSKKSDAVSPSSSRFALYGKGGAAALRSGQDALLAQVILSQALPPEVARKQLEAFIRYAERLGELQFDVRHGQNDFRYAIRWQYASH